MKKLILLLFAISFSLIVKGQSDDRHQFEIIIGAHYNGSSQEWMQTTGVGLFFESNFLVKENLRLGYRFEPTALAYGVWILPGGCGGDCREGANYLLGNYLKAEYLLGNPKIGKKGGKYQCFAGLSFNIMAHRRWIITSKEQGNWKDTLRWIVDPGAGVRFGAMLGNMDIYASYNLAGNELQNFYGLGMGYRILKK
ncbi:MAG: hypothetical protein WBA74_18715 [Cyclobacteriaceae bacterium]